MSLSDGLISLLGRLLLPNEIVAVKNFSTLSSPFWRSGSERRSRCCRRRRRSCCCSECNIISWPKIWRSFKSCAQLSFSAATAPRALETRTNKNEKKVVGGLQKFESVFTTKYVLLLLPLLKKKKRCGVVRVFEASCLWSFPQLFEEKIDWIKSQLKILLKKFECFGSWGAPQKMSSSLSVGAVDDVDVDVGNNRSRWRSCDSCCACD